jgi:pilus assembly protein CpaE
MPHRPLLLAVRANPELIALLERVAGPQGLGVAKIHQYLANGSRVDLAQLPQDAPCIAFVDFAADPEQAIETAEKLSANVIPRVWPVAVSGTSDADTLLRAMRAGCQEFLRWPATDTQLESTLSNVLRRVASAESEPSRNGQLVVFIGVRGGVGATTLAVHAALALAGTPNRNTLLVDLKRQLGHVAVYLNVTNPGYSFGDILDNVHRLDGALLRTMLVPQSASLSVLCSPDNCNALSDSLRRQHFRPNPTVEVIDKVLTLLRAEHDLILVDADPGLPETAILAQRAEHVFLIASLDIGSMRDMARYVDLLGRNPDRQRLVITRVERGGVLTPDMFLNATSLPIAASIPDLSEPISSAINAGIQVPQQVRGFYTGLKAVLALIDEQAVFVPRKNSFSLFGRQR